ncbi:hypothetical protein AB0300_11115 [Microbacterium sp. NPDC078814]|jgi:hypothetical protein|uniref:hypothetical protein n=1 Tax=Microbacterium sp. NPDC078814 TaxID=3154767 RepID=UPI0034510ACA
MIDHDRATLAIYSESRTVAEITASLRLEPTEAANIGEQTRSGRAGRAYKPEYLTYQRTTWLLDVTARSTGDDEGVNASLITDLAAIGCEVRGTVFLDDHDAGRDGVEFRFDD